MRSPRIRAAKHRRSLHGQARCRRHVHVFLPWRERAQRLRRSLRVRSHSGRRWRRLWMPWSSCIAIGIRARCSQHSASDSAKIRRAFCILSVLLTAMAGCTWARRHAICIGRRRARNFQRLCPISGCVRMRPWNWGGISLERLRETYGRYLRYYSASDNPRTRKVRVSMSGCAAFCHERCGSSGGITMSRMPSRARSMRRDCISCARRLCAMRIRRRRSASCAS